MAQILAVQSDDPVIRKYRESPQVSVVKKFFSAVSAGSSNRRLKHVTECWCPSNFRMLGKIMNSILNFWCRLTESQFADSPSQQFYHKTKRKSNRCLLLFLSSHENDARLKAGKLHPRFAIFWSSGQRRQWLLGFLASFCWTRNRSSKCILCGLPKSSSVRQ